MITIAGFVSFENHREFKDYLINKLSGSGAVCIELVDNINDYHTVLQGGHFTLNKDSCKVLADNKGNIALVFDKRKLKLVADYPKLKAVKKNKQSLLNSLDTIKYVMGETEIVTKIEKQINALAKSIEALYNEKEHETD